MQQTNSPDFWLVCFIDLWCFTEQPDWSEERQVVMAAENHRAELRGAEAMAKLRAETSRKMAEAQRINIAR